MKRYWLMSGLAMRLLATTIVLSEGEALFVNGSEWTVVSAAHKSL